MRRTSAGSNNNWFGTGFINGNALIEKSQEVSSSGDGGGG